MRNDLADPYAIHAIFTAPGSPAVPWVFARDLLMSGLRGSAGMGDVRAWSTSPDEHGISPYEQWVLSNDHGPPEDLRDVYIGLISPDGDVLLHFSGTGVGRFLSRTYDQCFPGDEHAHVENGPGHRTSAPPLTVPVRSVTNLADPHRMLTDYP